MGSAYEPAFDQGLHHAWEEGYVRVNQAFARAILSELEREPDATVFFHDYHLYLVPYFVRKEAPDALLAHFIHIPWPQQDMWRVLPEPIRRAVHEGLLGNDIVSFHARRWSRNFVRSCADFVGVERRPRGGLARLRRPARPRAARIRSRSTRPSSTSSPSPSRCAPPSEELVARRPEKLILRVDRTDLSKNIVRGFRAFEAYLAAHPEMHGRVTMLALLDPSRQDIPELRRVPGRDQRAARSVNDRFQPEGWVPIELSVEDDFARSVAAYKQYDVLLVNAIFDGLNLVAKEAPLVNERDGVLILSENAGAYEELHRWAITVNPFDVSEQAEAIHEALEMPASERRARIEAIRAHVREHDLTAWIGAQLSDLDRWAARAVRS